MARMITSCTFIARSTAASGYAFSTTSPPWFGASLPLRSKADNSCANSGGQIVCYRQRIISNLRKTRELPYPAAHAGRLFKALACRSMKRALLCICPPYPMVAPPAGAAALLGYLKAHGIADFGFLDLRLGTPPCYESTYSATGVFGESFVMDIPDLPLVLQLLAAVDSNRSYEFVIDGLIEKYCLERGISAIYLGSYLNALSRYYERAFEQYAGVDFFG